MCECNCDFFECNVSSPFTNPIDCTMDKVSPSSKTDPYICHCKSKIIMRMC